MTGYTIVERLRDAGWTASDDDFERIVLGCSVVGRDDMLRPRSRATGEPVRLRDLLPAGAVIKSRGDDAGEMGRVEYSPRSHYVRLRADQDFESPMQVLAALVAADALIVVAA
jgi:hypothetical protein